MSKIDILKNPLNENKNLMSDDSNDDIILSQNNINPQKIELFVEESSSRIIEKMTENKNEVEEMAIEEKANNNDNLMDVEEEKNEEEKSNHEDDQSDLSFHENEEMNKNMEEEKY